MSPFLSLYPNSLTNLRIICDMKTYRAARVVWGIVYTLGVILFVVGLVTGLFALLIAMGGGDQAAAAQHLFFALCGGGTAVAALMLMAMSDLVLAVVDTAENTQSMLAQMRQNSRL